LQILEKESIWAGRSNYIKRLNGSCSIDLLNEAVRNRRSD